MQEMCSEKENSAFYLKVLGELPILSFPGYFLTPFQLT